jgi:hypothetical protein
MSEQTHEDREWLDEEDREENVSGDWRSSYRRVRSPAVAQNERRDADRNNDTNTKNCARVRSGEDRVSLTGLMALRSGAAVVRLCLAGHEL